MRKLANEIRFRYIMLRVWLYEKKNGTPFEMFQFGLFWMLIMVLTSILIGKIL